MGKSQASVSHEREKLRDKFHARNTSELTYKARAYLEAELPKGKPVNSRKTSR